MSEVPNPGSEEAYNAGCTCAIVDNHFGRGSGRKDEHGNPVFWITQGCPLHAPLEDTDDR